MTKRLVVTGVLTFLFLQAFSASPSRAQAVRPGFGIGVEGFGNLDAAGQPTIQYTTESGLRLDLIPLVGLTKSDQDHGQGIRFTQSGQEYGAGARVFVPIRRLEAVDLGGFAHLEYAESTNKSEYNIGIPGSKVNGSRLDASIGIEVRFAFPGVPGLCSSIRGGYRYRESKSTSTPDPSMQSGSQPKATLRTSETGVVGQALSVSYVF